MINPRSILRMRHECKEAAWHDLCFESKAQSHRSYAEWVTKVLSKPLVVENIVKASIRTSMECLKSLLQSAITAT